MNDVENIEKKIKYAWISGIVCGTSTLILALVGIIPLFALIEACLVFGLTFGIYKKSRACAVIMFIYFVITRFIRLSFFRFMTEAKNPLFLGGITVAAIFCCLFFEGIQGTFAYHRMTKH